MPIFRAKNEKFFEKWSPEMAYVLGFFIADGSMVINPRGARYLDFHITDGDLLKEIRRTLGSNHKIRKEKRKLNWKRAYRLQIGSKKMFGDLLSLGITPRKTGHEKLPTVPSVYFQDFVRGYFDGDGNVWTGYTHKKDRPNPSLVLVVVFTSKSREFLSSLKQMLNKKLRLKGQIRYYSGAYRLSFSIRDSLRLYHFMYDNLKNSLFLNRKKERFEKFIEFRGGVA